jgi:uncharacterized protein
VKFVRCSLRSAPWLALLCASVPTLILAVGGARAWGETVAQLPAHATSYVEDFAGVIDPASKGQMEALSHEVYEKAHATVEVVTVKSMDGDTIEDYATQLEDKWKVGPKGSDRGVLMLFSIGDRKRRVEVGYGLEGILNDSKVGDIGRSMVPALQAGQYGPAILDGEEQIANVIAADAGVTLQAPQVQHQYHREPVGRKRSFNWVGLLIFFLFIMLTFRGGRRGGGSIWPWFFLGNMMGGGGRWRGRDDDWGGGPGGGGGGDGGGGGGDFGGGFGGGSGGGGASGDW